MWDNTNQLPGEPPQPDDLVSTMKTWNEEKMRNQLLSTTSRITFAVIFLYLIQKLFEHKHAKNMLVF